MVLLAKKPEDRYGSTTELAEDLRRAREGLPLASVGAAGRAETVRTPAVAAAPPVPGSTCGARPDSLRGRSRRVKVAALATLIALLVPLGALGWDPPRIPEGVDAVSAPQGGPLGAPEAPGGDERIAGGGDAGGTEEAPNGGAPVGAGPDEAARRPPAPGASVGTAVAVDGPGDGGGEGAGSVTPSAGPAGGASAASASPVLGASPTPGSQDGGQGTPGAAGPPGKTSTSRSPRPEPPIHLTW